MQLFSIQKWCSFLDFRYKVHSWRIPIWWHWRLYMLLSHSFPFRSLRWTEEVLQSQNLLFSGLFCQSICDILSRNIFLYHNSVNKLLSIWKKNWLFVLFIEILCFYNILINIIQIKCRWNKYRLFLWSVKIMVRFKQYNSW